MSGLVLSIFPGIDLLGMAFEAEGFCVVRGPDLIWGGDVRSFHPMPGRFDGVIGGPPCQPHSDATIGHAPRHECMIGEYERIVSESRAAWFVMEQVKGAPMPRLPKHFGCPQCGQVGTWSEQDGWGLCEECRHRWALVHRVLCDAWDFGATQRRVRSFCSNLKLAPVGIALNACQNPLPTVLATEHKYSAGSKDKRRAGRALGRRMTLAEVNQAMGLPEDFSTPAFTKAASYEARGNGVPIPMGRAIARAVKQALQQRKDEAA